jgi:O-antigen ligase
MPPHIAAIVFYTGIAGLFYLDRDRGTRTSPALWIAIAWLFIGSSRMLSFWLTDGSALKSPDQYLEGSPFDRAVLTILIVMALGLLARRWRLVLALLRNNKILLLFIVYAGLSVFWSDYPFVAFKRWTKMLGNVTIVLLVATERDPGAAIGRVLTRTGFLLVPLSVLLIKYYPDIGRFYDRWTWTVHYAGMGDNKNSLGMICLVFGLGAVWRLTSAGQRHSHWPASIAHWTIVGMALWLFNKADSATSFVCFLVGTALILTLKFLRARSTAALHAIMAVLICSALLAYLFPGIYLFVIDMLDRNPTLTGRTDIWDEAIRLSANLPAGRWLGAGFESFWLGPRVEYFWDRYSFRPNQAHNGYLETYLHLGWIGFGLLCLLVFAGYRHVTAAFRRDPLLGRMVLAFYVVALLYNITEAAFKVMTPIWIMFLFCVCAGARVTSPGPELLHDPADPEPASHCADIPDFSHIRIRHSA